MVRWRAICALLSGAVFGSAAMAVSTPAQAYKQPAGWRHLPGIGLPKSIRCCFRYDVVVRGALSGDFGDSNDSSQRGRYLFQWGLRQRGIDLLPQYHTAGTAILFPLSVTEEAHFESEADGVQLRHQTPQGDFKHVAETDFFHCKPLLVNHPFEPVKRTWSTPLGFWDKGRWSNSIHQQDRRHLRAGCGAYSSVTGVPGPLNSNPRWNPPGYRVPALSLHWAASGKGSRTVVCALSSSKTIGASPDWQFKGAREAYVRVTYFPFSRLSHYLLNLNSQSDHDAFQEHGGRSRFPREMSPGPFADIINNPTAPFGPNNPKNGCHRAP